MDAIDVDMEVDDGGDDDVNYLRDISKQLKKHPRLNEQYKENMKKIAELISEDCEDK